MRDRSHLRLPTTVIHISAAPIKTEALGVRAQRQRNTQTPTAVASPSEEARTSSRPMTAVEFDPPKLPNCGHAEIIGSPGGVTTADGVGRFGGVALGQPKPSSVNMLAVKNRVIPARNWSRPTKQKGELTFPEVMPGVNSTVPRKVVSRKNNRTDWVGSGIHAWLMGSSLTSRSFSEF